MKQVLMSLVLAMSILTGPAFARAQDQVNVCEIYVPNEPQKPDSVIGRGIHRGVAMDRQYRLVIVKKDLSSALEISKEQFEALKNKKDGFKPYDGDTMVYYDSHPGPTGKVGSIARFRVIEIDSSLEWKDMNTLVHGFLPFVGDEHPFPGYIVVKRIGVTCNRQSSN